MIERVHVDLGERAYEVLIGEGLLGQAGRLMAPLLHRPRVAVVSDATVAGHHLAALKAALASEGIEAASLELPPGEATKCWGQLETVCGWLLDQKVERRDVVVALGGGVIGDLVGFAAAVLRRGVRFVQIPTSLLAQVDSSVGGKTGINTPHGKNLIGAFHQPSLVLADTGILATLPRRDLLAGYGEVVKYGLLGDAAFFAWLEGNGPKLAAGDPAARLRAVTRSVEMKAGIVMRDETEQGDRALLNLGHTFCHALEAATGYSDRLLHGEGVAIGCALAFELSSRLGLCPQEDPSRVRAHLREMGMKTDLADIPGALPGPDALIELMAQDKKVLDGKLRFILARGIAARHQLAARCRRHAVDLRDHRLRHGPDQPHHRRAAREEIGALHSASARCS
ncbi:3-dehydroquinate synthase [Mangrovicoccus ximenensis]|uniref:3-dehydroquinate synthase n=1 Tax=Mangrovicoccus ximenensis TaxID=1911570 RepID=UPI000D38B510|nr:3-dehydroquinate synthase [Mangrovicoccus ximenensis]